MTATSCQTNRPKDRPAKVAHAVMPAPGSSARGQAPAGIHDSYEVSPVKWKFAHLATFPSVFSCCD
jgi:hypothetical protein